MTIGRNERLSLILLLVYIPNPENDKKLIIIHINPKYQRILINEFVLLKIFPLII